MNKAISKGRMCLSLIAIGALSMGWLIPAQALAACASPGKCIDTNVCVNYNGTTPPGSSCPKSGDVCCVYTEPTTCSGSTTSNSPCKVGNITEVPDGPNAKCPTNFIMAGCSNQPKSGTGKVLCCENPAGGTGSQCGPPAGVVGLAYLCLRPEGCVLAQGTVMKDIKPPDTTCSQSEEVCCITKARTGQTVTDPKKTDSKPAPAKVYNLYNPLGTTSIPELIGRVIKMFLGVIGAVALAVFVYGGVMWMTARGDSKQLDNARGALVNAAMGLVIIGFAYTLTTSMIAMFTTVPVATPESSSANTATQAETEAAQEQTSISEQKAAEQQAQQQKSVSACGAQVKVSANTPNDVYAGYSCQPSNNCSNILSLSPNPCSQTNQLYCCQPK